MPCLTMAVCAVLAALLWHGCDAGPPASLEKEARPVYTVYDEKDLRDSIGSNRIVELRT